MLLSHRPLATKFSKSTSILIFCTIILLVYTLSRFDEDQFLPKAPSKVEKDIPKKIWYKLGPRGLSEEAAEWAQDCLAKNPGYTSEYMNDSSSDDYVRKNFARRPNLVESYLNLPIPILKADFLRYLLLYREGGVWFDLDVSCGEFPIDDWIPPQFKANTSLVVGWEFDAGLSNDVDHQLASWTIMARPGSPHILMAIENILLAIREETIEHNVTIAELRLDMLPDVVDFTGPARLTKSVYQSLDQTLGIKFDRSLVQGILEPTLLGDVLFLPGYACAASQGQYPEEDLDKVGPPLVSHHYAGSWKNEHGGESQA